MRTYDVNLIRDTVKFLTKGRNKADVDEWVKDDRNVALVNDKGDITLVEYCTDGVSNIHYNFTSKGRAAINVGKAFLDEIFNGCYNIEVIRGFTPLTNVASRWINRRFGATSGGIVSINDKKYELFIITKKEFLNE